MTTKHACYSLNARQKMRDLNLIYCLYLETKFQNSPPSPPQHIYDLLMVPKSCNNQVASENRKNDHTF